VSPFERFGTPYTEIELAVQAYLAEGDRTDVESLRASDLATTQEMSALDEAILCAEAR
jgi:hypothetical protein